MTDKAKDHIIGYAAGIAAGVSYGFNPLFAKPLLEDGVSVYSMLFFRYAVAALLMSFWMLFKHESFAVTRKQLPVLILLGILFAFSSIGLFEAYNYIPAGLATTVVYLYPVFTALIMIFAGKKPGLRTWIAIMVTLAGVLLMCKPGTDAVFDAMGILLAAFSALSYSLYLVIVNNNRTVSNVTPHTITFNALVTGALLFLALGLAKGSVLMHCISGIDAWVNITGLALVPTIISLLTLAIATRKIGATKTAILGVFEPVTALLVGVLAFGEALTFSTLSGIFICMAAVTFLVADKRGC